MKFQTDNWQIQPQSAGLRGKQVLVVGYRQSIIDVLERLQIPFAVWHDRPIKRSVKCLKSCSQAFPRRSRDIRSFAEHAFAGFGPFTDVIAGTESSVYVASICRRALGARQSKDSIALRCSDKQHMKSLMKRHHVPMTDYLSRSEVSSFQDVLDRLGPKVVVKQRRNSGGRGLSIARTVDELASRKERGLLYERYVDADEFSIETFVQHGQIRFTSTTNYLVKAHANLVPADLAVDVLQTAHQINRQVVAALNLQWGLTHAEFYWNRDGVLFGEIALRPPGGYIMECITLAYNFDSWEAFVANEIDLPYSFPGHCNRTAGVAVLHAGEGIVKSIQNAEEASRLPSCVRFKVLVKPGDQVSARAGVGEVSAYGLFVSDSPNTTRQDVLRCLELVQFQLERD